MNNMLDKYKIKEYTIFGSDDSSDVDVMFYIDTLPELQICRQIATEASSLIVTDREVDVNLCSVSNGIVTDCMKGTIDEVNNMIFFTHGLHAQEHYVPIQSLVARNIECKAARALRGILSFISRTEYREIVKSALRGNVEDKIKALRSIKLEKLSNLGKDKLVIEDFYKLFTFQVGQCIPLIEDGIELYTKKDISVHYPIFEPYLYRMLDVFPDIDIYKNYFLDVVSKLNLDNVHE